MYFNDDNVLDLVMRFSKGAWDIYDNSLIKILDGTSGKDILWSLNCSDAIMSSPVVLRNKKKGHDGVLFFGMGCEKNTPKQIHNDVTTCPKRNLKLERDVCEAKREMRESDNGINFDEIIPDNLWEIENESDQFPNPLTHPDEFMAEYCKLDIESLSANLYFLTPKLISDGIITDPLITFKPFIHSK